MYINKLNKVQLREWNAKGLFPYPEETEAHFLARVIHLQTFCPQREISLASFDVICDWVCVDVCDQGLALWEGAVTWEEISNGGWSIPSIQIRRKKGLYAHALRHEVVHAVRLGFKQKMFEEILAYQTGNSWRRFLGPLLRDPLEMKFFLGALCLSLSVQWIDLFIALPHFCLWGIYLPWVLAAYGFLRLLRCQRIFKRCLKRLNRENALAIALRLTDEEICLFSKSSSLEIETYVQREREKTVRWKTIAAAYF